MDRIELACYGLLASALILAGVLVARLPGHSPAQADLVIARDNLVVMTARASGGDDALFVLDVPSDKLLIYTLALRGNAGRFTLANAIDLSAEFAKVPGPVGGGAGDRPMP